MCTWLVVGRRFSPRAAGVGVRQGTALCGGVGSQAAGLPPDRLTQVEIGPVQPSSARLAVVLVDLVEFPAHVLEFAHHLRLGAGVAPLAVHPGELLQHGAVLHRPGNVAVDLVHGSEGEQLPDLEVAPVSRHFGPLSLRFAIPVSIFVRVVFKSPPLAGRTHNTSSRRMRRFGFVQPPLLP